MVATVHDMTSRLTGNGTPIIHRFDLRSRQSRQRPEDRRQPAQSQVRGEAATLDKTYRLIYTTQSKLIIRLGAVQIQVDDKDFLRKAALLDYYNQWMQAEREFRLCRSLHVALRETETLAGRLAGRVADPPTSRLTG